MIVVARVKAQTWSRFMGVAGCIQAGLITSLLSNALVGRLGLISPHRVIIIDMLVESRISDALSNSLYVLPMCKRCR